MNSDPLYKPTHQRTIGSAIPDIFMKRQSQLIETNRSGGTDWIGIQEPNTAEIKSLGQNSLSNLTD